LNNISGLCNFRASTIADRVMAETKKKWLRPSTPSSRPGASNMTRRSSEDRDALLACYDFPAEHWKHLRTTNIIESSFATVCRRTVGSKGCLSNKTALPFKLAEAAERSWQNQLPKIILSMKFIDGIEVVRSQAQTAAA
jgi:transposase-like protein